MHAEGGRLTERVTMSEQRNMHAEAGGSKESTRPF